MELSRRPFSLLTCLVALGLAIAPAVSSAKEEEGRGKPTVKCRMKFDLSSWAFLYKSGKGQGTITCDNGQRADVKIRTHGGGATFGKMKIENGSGTFTKVHDISELFGSYARTEAHAGASGHAEAQSMTKGGISMSLAGTGHGFDIGIAFGSFKISPLTEKDKKKK